MSCPLHLCVIVHFQEELGFMLEVLGLREDALIQYDELDAMFDQFVENHASGGDHSWRFVFSVVLPRGQLCWMFVWNQNTVARKSVNKMNISEESLEMCFHVSLKIDIECWMRPGKTGKFPRFKAGLFIYFFFFPLLFLFCFAIGKFEHVMHTVLWFYTEVLKASVPKGITSGCENSRKHTCINLSLGKGVGLWGA